MSAAARPALEPWQYAMRAVLVAVCVGTVVVTLTTLGIRIRQSGFSSPFGPVASAEAPPAPAPLSAADSAARAHPFSKLIPNDPPPPGVDTRSGLANSLLLGAFAGLLAAGLTAWSLLGPLNSLYRRGGLSLTAAVGTLIGTMLAVPFDMLLRQTGQLIFVALLALVAWRAYRSIAGAELIEPAAPT